MEESLGTCIAEAAVCNECPTQIQWRTWRRTIIKQLALEIDHRDSRIRELEEALGVLAIGRRRLMDAVEGEAYGDKASSKKHIQLRTDELAAHKAIESNPTAKAAIEKARAE